MIDIKLPSAFLAEKCPPDDINTSSVQMVSTGGVLEEQVDE